MWTIQPYDEFVKRLKTYQKKWQHEVTNASTNLETAVTTLNQGVKSEQLKKLGFVHSEPLGLLAIDQRGRGKGSKLKQLRIYVYPEEVEQVLHVFTIGDKDSQRDDIKRSIEEVNQILKKKSGE